MAKPLAAPVDWPVSTSWKLPPFWTTEALTPMSGVLLMALARPSSVTPPVSVTATPPMVSVPALATMVESWSVWVLDVPVTWARARLDTAIE